MKSTYKSAHMVTVAGYEVGLEVPAWVGKGWGMTQSFFTNLLHGSPQEENIYMFIRRDFFEPIWEGMLAEPAQTNHVAPRTNSINRMVRGRQVEPVTTEAGVAVVTVAGMPRLALSDELERKISLWLGIMLLVVAMGVLGAVAGPVVYGEARQVIKGIEVSKLNESQKTEIKKAEQVTFADYVASDEVLSETVPVSREFGLIIPKIEVNSLVTRDVDASKAEAYSEALKKGLAHASGSALPGGKGDIFIFGHSTDYAWNVADWNALFYNLKDLERGDKVYLYYQGKPRIYQVTEKKVYEPKDVSWLRASSGTERLVLQTCWPPGTTLKRLVVFAEPLPEFTQLK